MVADGKAHVDGRKGRPCPVGAFLRVLREKYFLETAREHKEVEFLKLVQGIMTGYPFEPLGLADWVILGHSGACPDRGEGPYGFRSGSGAATKEVPTTSGKTLRREPDAVSASKLSWSCPTSSCER